MEKLSASALLRDAVSTLLRQMRPTLPDELVALISSFLPDLDDEGPDRSFSQNAALCQPNEELWQLTWLVSLAKVNRELDELLRPLLWTNVAIYVDCQATNVSLMKRLRGHLERFPSDRRTIRRMTLDLTIVSDYSERMGGVFGDVDFFLQLKGDWPFDGMSEYEEECARLAAVFPENLRVLQVNCGQLRLPPKAWQHIAERCPNLAVARIDANAEFVPFRRNVNVNDEPRKAGDYNPTSYPTDDDAFDLLRQPRGVALGCGPEDPPVYGETERWRADDLETVAIGIPHLTEWLKSNSDMLWLRLAAPELTWQPSLFGVWARLLGLETAPLQRRSDDAFVVGSCEHGEGPDIDTTAETDVLLDTAAMALRPHLDMLAQHEKAVTAGAVLSMIRMEPELVAWTWDRDTDQGIGPLFTATSYEASSSIERSRLEAIVEGYSSTQEARRRGRELGCPFEGPEHMEENTVEFARAHLLREMPSTYFGKQMLNRLAAMSPLFAESARKAKRIE